jgi:hypothetical protein
MHGNRRNAILKKYRQGYRLSAIAREHGCRKCDVAMVLNEHGVAWCKLTSRERRKVTTA